MRLISLTTRGWRRFLDESTIDFSQSSDRSVTLIHGENGAGKTALLNAILWCTTGQTTPRLKSPGNLQYYSTELGGFSDECSVTLIFEHEGTWCARRTLEGPRQDFQLGKKNTAGDYEWLPSSMAQREMNLILPPRMATYFFFDGEGFNQGQLHSERSFGESVKNILGFEFARQTLDEIERVQSVVGREINKINKTAQTNAKDAREYQEAVDKLEKIDEEFKRQREKERSAQIEMDRAKVEIDAYGHEAIQEREAKIRSLRSELNEQQVGQSSAEEGLRGLVRRYAALTFSLDLANKGREILKNKRKTGQYPAKFQQPLIKDLLEIGECICGSPLSDSQRRVLESKLDVAGTEEESDRIATADRKASLNLDQFAEFQREHDGYRKTIDEKKREIARIKAEIERLESEQVSFDEKDFDALKTFYKQEENKRDSALLQLAELKRSRAFNENIRAKKKPTGLSPGDEARRRRLEGLIAKLGRVKAAAEEYLDNTVDVTATHIGALMRHDLRRTDISHQIHVDKSTLKFAYVDRDGKEVGESTGEELFLNLSFASALSKIAAIRSKITNGILIPGAVGPLVIDAPFGDLDPTNARIIYEVLKESTDQLILLLSRSHWEPLDDVMRPSLGAEYLLIRQHAESVDEEQELKEIEIEGAVYPLVSHDFDYPSTVVERIK